MGEIQLYYITEHIRPPSISTAQVQENQTKQSQVNKVSKQKNSQGYNYKSLGIDDSEIGSPHVWGGPKLEGLALFSTRRPNTARSGDAGLKFQEAEAEPQDLCGLSCEFMAGLVHLVRPCLKMGVRGGGEGSRSLGVWSER